MINWKEIAIYTIVFVVLGILSYTVHQLYKTNREQLAMIEAHKSVCHTDDEIIFYDQAITSLKIQNQELYDSLQMYKDELEYVARFQYKKIYIINTIVN